jgi:hypothetical protein
MLACAPALADETLDGEDAAYIDWSWRHCGTVSTAKEHALADAANAKGGAQFHADYLKHLHEIADVDRTPAQVASLCSQIEDRYGPEATIMPGLISAKEREGQSP